MDICDIHGHFLPGMDDGCKDVDEAIRLLQYAYAMGIRKMCATAHYYPVESVEDFLRRRKKAADALEKEIKKRKLTDIPQYCLGAEVAYRPGLGSSQELHRLCLGNSRYMLLEMPFYRWTETTVRDVNNICRVQGIVPIYAHLERYVFHQRPAYLHRLLREESLAQCNAGVFRRFFKRWLFGLLVKKGTVRLLGSDCHNMENRKPNLDEAVGYLTKHGGKKALGRIARLSSDIFTLAQKDPEKGVD